MSNKKKNNNKKLLLILIPLIVLAIGITAVFAVPAIMNGSSESSSEQSEKVSAYSEGSESSKDESDGDNSADKKSHPKKDQSDNKDNDNPDDQNSGENSDETASDENSDDSESSNDGDNSDGSADNSENESSVTDSDSDPAESRNTDESSETPESSVTDEPLQHDSGLQASLSSAGCSFSDLQSRGCRQIITVNSTGSYAEIRFYELNNDNVWENDSSFTANGFVGRNGVSRDNYEGSGMTPFGLYGVGEAFYIDSVPQTSLDMFHVTEDTYWVDDPNSAFYNKRVEGTSQKDWNSAEHMIQYYYSYHYGFVIEYNTENPVPGKGSAFFFHVSTQPTAGCVGLSESMVLKYLARLDKNMHPFILMQ